MANIRFANSSDLTTIRRFDPYSSYIDPKRIKVKLENQEIIIAEIGEKLVGILKFSYFWMTRPYIDLIYVENSHRMKGISGQLLQYLENYLSKEGYAYLFSSSEEKDTNAQYLHQHMGFKEIGILADLNKPHDDTAEIFYSKKISDVKKLRKYDVL